MNFLAHIYLSGDDPELMVGNFIADFVKGNKKDAYSPGIKKGIELHRAIDDFTDHHPVALRSQSRIRSSQGKYSGIVIDLFYDHFLAKNFINYHEQPLKEFSRNTYTTVKKYWLVLPTGVQFLLPFMIQRNWLLNYSTIEGINRALTGLSMRVSFKNKMNEAVKDLKEHYTELEDDFNEFFPLLKDLVDSRR
jgi:acyl carrier protein phosphodiesterase